MVAEGKAQCAEEAASAHSGGQVCTLLHVGLVISGVCVLSGAACLLSLCSFALLPGAGEGGASVCARCHWPGRSSAQR